MKALFIGNSATYVNEIPKTLSRLAKAVGYTIETEQITPGGCELFRHADLSAEHGQKVFAEIAKGYDIVFLQDNGNCVSTDEKRANCIDASRRLCNAIKKSGARACFYVRPPYGTVKAERNPFEQCVAFDELFGEIARENGAECVYVNRAFAYAIKHLPYELWGDDHAHTGKFGAYLIVYTFFATLFGVSATLLDANGLDESDARELQNAADRIVFDGVIPWDEASE